jgi:hypothetical protein
MPDLMVLMTLMRWRLQDRPRLLPALTSRHPRAGGMILVHPLRDLLPRPSALNVARGKGILTSLLKV